MSKFQGHLWCCFFWDDPAVIQENDHEGTGNFTCGGIHQAPSFRGCGFKALGKGQELNQVTKPARAGGWSEGHQLVFAVTCVGARCGTWWGNICRHGQNIWGTETFSSCWCGTHPSTSSSPNTKIIQIHYQMAEVPCSTNYFIPCDFLSHHAPCKALAEGKCQYNGVGKALLEESKLKFCFCLAGVEEL